MLKTDVVLNRKDAASEDEAALLAGSDIWAPGEESAVVAIHVGSRIIMP